MADKHILIVDDDRELVDVLTTVLESAGYHISSASNGKEGWEKASASPPDLAIIDVIMDTIGEGVQLAHRFRSNEKLKDVPIIMLTAIDQQLRFNIGQEAGEEYLPVDKFIEKPVEPSTLLKEIESLLKA